ncbi:MAG TPA: glutathione S-transferase [Polyangiaceae bacterium]|jgi:glutathione S-transferase|nr:glutathione S-transferase [Polyangiaceae bacterium]
MGDSRRVLLQFPISHYCEKTRWHLDLKRLPYETRNVLPGVHMFINKQLATGRTVPVLIDEGRAIGDSTAIALHLESRYPDASLLAAPASERARILETETYFDDTLGPAVRRWVYGHALNAPGMVRSLFFRGYGALGRAAGRFVTPVLEREIRRLYRINDAGVEEASRQIDAAVERLEQQIDGNPDRYLVGDRLTLADLTAASLLGPLVAPPGSPWAGEYALPAPIPPRREALRARPAGKWVAARYAKDRPLPVTAGAA